MFGHDDHDEESDVKHLPLRQMLQRIVPFFRPHKGTLIIATVMLLLVTAAELGGPLLVKIVLDQDIPGSDGRGLLFHAVIYAVLFIFGMGLAYLQVIMLAKMGLRIVTELREQVFAHLLSLSLAHFDKNPPGKLMARVESDIEKLLMLFSDVALALFRNIVLLGGTFAVMIYTNARVTFAIFLLMVPVVVCTYFFLQYIRKRYRIIRKMYAGIIGFLTEYVQSIPILQIYGYTEKALHDLVRLNKAKFSKEVRLAYVEYGFWGAFFAVEIVAVMLIIFVGSRNFGGVGMTVGTLVLFIEYTRRLFWPLLMFSEQLNQIQRAFASADRVFALLDTPSRTPDLPDAIETVPDDWQEICFDNVTFTYDGGVKALDEVNLRIQRGEMVALVGLSGGGKSTVTNLLLRYYETSAGAVLLDGVDIRRYRQQAWRSKIGLVLQDIHLFPGTLGENLRVLRDEIPQEAIERAIKVVQAEAMVERLPDSYDTIISEGGANLSMGERQMLCFARAVVEDPDILILDEATSAVDPVTERRLQEALDHLMEGRTSLIVAHRLSTITKADRILVMHHGKLVEQGSHDELYAADGIYRDLFDLQFAASEQENHAEKPLAETTADAMEDE
jgi:ABC-type multidrug transport system fused ATPase/permease subunit